MSLNLLQEQILRDMEQMIMSSLLSDGASQVRPMSSAEEARLRQEHANKNLTYAMLIELEDKWRREMEAAASATAPPIANVLTIIEVPETPIYAPVRKHRKRRIQKKWLKRYGTKIVGYDRPLGDQIYIHEKSGVAFCHPDTVRLIEQYQLPVEMRRFQEMYVQD